MDQDLELIVKEVVAKFVAENKDSHFFHKGIVKVLLDIFQEIEKKKLVISGSDGFSLILSTHQALCDEDVKRIDNKE